VAAANDRLINWGGNFDTFIVPFKQWREPLVNRTPAPALVQYLSSLSEADGADNLYADYNAAKNPNGSANIDYIAGLDPMRNGEPFGEAGIYVQSDAFWQLQHGKPNQQPAGNLQVEATVAPAGQAAASLTDAQLAAIVAAAEELWTAALGDGDPRLAVLNRVTVSVADLVNGTLGDTTGQNILIDRTAAGWGWYVDATPLANSEFAISLGNGVFAADPASPAAGHMDLLTTVLHELGNAMGFPEDAGQDVAGMSLAAGIRRLPLAASVSAVDGSAAVTATTAVRMIPTTVPDVATTVAAIPATPTAMTAAETTPTTVPNVATTAAAAVTPPSAIVSQVAQPLAPRAFAQALPPGVEGLLLTRLATPVPAWITPPSDGTASGEAAAFAFPSSDDLFRAIRDSEISFTVADQSGAPTGESTPTWLFDESAGAFVAREAERLTIVIDDTGDTPQPVPQLSQAGDTSADDLLTSTPPTSWFGALRDFGRAATKAWFDT